MDFGLRHRNICRLFSLSIFCCLFAPLHSDAQGTPAVSFPSSDLSYFAGSTAVVGYSFTVNTTISVLDLEFYDVGGDGLGGSAQVGLWTADGTLLTQATIPDGNSAPILDGFRYVPLTTPQILQAGQTYVVGGRASSTDQTVFLEPDAVFAPEISYGINQFGGNGSFTFPTYTGGGTTSSAGDFGGSFTFEDVPEPTSLGLLLAGGVCVGLFQYWFLRSAKLR
jgi:hypothetical protein